MAEQDSTTNTGKRWPLLERVPPGLIKDNLIEIKEYLGKVLKVADILLTFYHHAKDSENETILLANETIVSFASMVEVNVDSVFHHLNLIFEPKPQAAPEGGCSMGETGVKATFTLDQQDAINLALGEIFTAAECLSCASSSRISCQTAQ